ncbi:hypothetical protein H4W23_00430 [Streptomyces gardneri]|uniref:hypothetical protein n=1 Tax=Streptomyces gardneri TaxID=66892 RepID=UPI0006BD69F1|nr:hypothetical protein [Streptomyces gardneri]QPK43271.1 hypothetical protein H4W23_00430 [Streptomyces gardneri]WRK34489.1 hypothetical protein U0M97_00415 [Streptomyces venezuelae]CUM44133.1 hypothetical protein BN2537_17231 [Streptomyces venezuelae]
MTATSSPPPTPPAPDAEQPLLTAHAALVLLMSIFFGTVIGVLTFLSVGSVAGALLAGLPAFGVSAVALHKLIGP